MQLLKQPFSAMACTCEIVIAAGDLPAARAPIAAAVAEVRRIEAKFSRYRPDSVISRINAAAGGAALVCDEETASLLAYADTLFQASGGLFDITAGVLRQAWDFKRPQLPSDETLARVCALIGWGRVERNANSVRLPQVGMELDFGGFGKEYAADRAAAVLAAAGIRHGYVSLGGDLRAIGPKPDGGPWMIGIQDPRRAGDIIASIPIERGGLATSGDYARFFELDGRRYCHLLNPHSGQPVTYWRTVSVVAPLAVMAGNCSTIAMLKEQDGLDFLEAAGVSYLAMDYSGEIHLGKPD
ncbi:FAD:protein FMN transferase [Pseudoduganella sp. FT55W]|uniref:FAD:protein FMN transferase n=1 Tax=Duganella rivi TaxID=2666083 RepID=A0A7X4KCP6_9BURK|nr:FAD:protein FMN transferase [Duganella rivi]MYM68410.1 FAD:protein FMN transferase [Duganella rivi]